MNSKARLKAMSLFTFTLLSLVLTLAACGGAPAAPASQAKPPLKVSYDLWPGYYPVLIAEGKGYFKDAGVQVEAINPEKTDTMLADFSAGKYDAVAAALGDLVRLSQTSPDIKIIFVSDESAGGDAIIGGPGIQSVSDLRNQRVGVNLGGFGELLVTTMLAENGMTPNDVTLVDIDAADIPAKLASGEIQAGHSWEPYVSQMVDQGGTVIFSSLQTPGLIPDAIAFRGETVRQRPDDVRAFTRAWFQAVDFWQAHREEGTAIAAAALKIPADTISLKGIKLLTLQDNMQLFKPGDTFASVYHTTSVYVDFYGRIGAIRTQPDIQQLFDASFLQP
jgi:NitT/TauT family transport system substrate-binding protein